MRALYLHGFASSARSSKATFFAAKLREHGVPLETPDFNEPDFSTLTVSRMIDQVGGLLGDVARRPALDGPASVLIGSSLGAVVAVQSALRFPERVSKLVLLAPALDFGGNRVRELGNVEAWERSNRLDVFHYGYGRVMPVHFELYRDACAYDCVNAELTLPIQMFQGRRDTAVSPEFVELWGGKRPNVELHMLDDDHQLIASLNHIWREMRRFIGL